jgi:hypothetical protein
MRSDTFKCVSHLHWMTEQGFTCGAREGLPFELCGKGSASVWTYLFETNVPPFISCAQVADVVELIDRECGTRGGRCCRVHLCSNQTCADSENIGSAQAVPGLIVHLNN